MASRFPGEEIQVEVTCVVCREFYKQPLLLPCGHTFCRGCLQTLLPPRPPLAFLCPRCHKQVTLTLGLDELLKNTAIANIVSSMQRFHRPTPNMTQDAQLQLRRARGSLEALLSVVADKQVKLVETMLRIQSESVVKKNEIATYVRQMCEELTRRKTGLLSQVDNCLTRAMSDCRTQQELLEARTTSLLDLANKVEDLIKKTFLGEQGVTETELKTIKTRLERVNAEEEPYEEVVVVPSQLKMPVLELSDFRLKVEEAEEGAEYSRARIEDYLANGYRHALESHLRVDLNPKDVQSSRSPGVNTPSASPPVASRPPLGPRHSSCLACNAGVAHTQCPSTPRTPNAARGRSNSTSPRRPPMSFSPTPSKTTSRGVDSPHQRATPIGGHSTRCSASWKSNPSRSGDSPTSHRPKLGSNSRDKPRVLPTSRVGPWQMESTPNTTNRSHQRGRGDQSQALGLASQLLSSRRYHSPRRGPRVTKVDLKHYNRFLLLEVAWSNYFGAHHYRVTTLGPGVPKVMEQVVEREEICLMAIYTTSVIIHHALFGSNYTLVVQAMNHDGACLSMSEPVHVKTPRMVLFEDVQFDPMGTHATIAVDDEMHGIYHRENTHLGREEWENFPLIENTGAGACYPFLQPALDFELVFFECKVTMTALKAAMEGESLVVCVVGLCKENCVDLTALLSTNPKCICCYFLLRETDVLLGYWNGWQNEMLEGLETTVLITFTDKMTAAIKLGFFLDLCKAEFAIVDAERSKMLQKFSLPQGHHQWLPVASLHQPDYASTTVTWIRPERLPDCVTTLLTGNP